MPVREDGRRFGSQAQLRQAWASDPDRARKWIEEEREAGITDHSQLPEKLHPELKTDPQTGKQHRVKETQQMAMSQAETSARHRDRVERETGARHSSRGQAAQHDQGNGRTARGSGRNSTNDRSNGDGRRNQRAGARSSGVRGGDSPTREELRDQARGSGIPGWYRMPKEELADALGIQLRRGRR